MERGVTAQAGDPESGVKRDWRGVWADEVVSDIGDRACGGGGRRLSRWQPKLLTSVKRATIPVGLAVPHPLEARQGRWAGDGM